MSQEPTLVDEIAQELNDQQGVELVPGRQLAQDILRIVARHAAAAWSRSGFYLDEEVLDEVLAERAGKAAGTFLQWDDALRMGRADALPFPIAALTDLLAAQAALRAALGYTPTPTAPELIQDRRGSDQITTAGDHVRLHLAAAHGVLFALGASDRLAAAEHLRRHAEAGHPPPGFSGGHTVDNLTWSDAGVQAEIALAEAEGMPRRQFDRPYADHQTRLAAAANEEGAGAGA